MSFTRFNYDKARTSKLLQESTGPGRWILNTPGNGTQPGYYEDPQIRTQLWGGNLMSSSTGHPVDIWSELDGRNRIQTHDGAQHHKEKQVTVKKVEYPTITTTVNESRVTHPALMYRDLPHVRWEYPIHDPQENTCLSFHNNVSTRIQQKDDFIPKLA